MEDLEEEGITETLCSDLCRASSTLQVEEETTETQSDSSTVYVKAGEDYMLECIVTQDFNDGGDNVVYEAEG